jgi:hypothetical protein
VVAGLGLVLVVLVVGVVARRQLRRLGAGRDRRAGTTLVLGLPPVPAPRPRRSAPDRDDRDDRPGEDREDRPAPLPGAAADRAPTRLPLEKVVVLAPPAVPRPVRRCGHCRAAGHTRTTCPRLTGALPLPQL